MEIKILEENKTKLFFSVAGEDHTLLNLLKEELWKDKAVKIAAYRVSHPSIGIPEMVVEVTQGNEPRKAITDAIKRLEKVLDKLRDELKDNAK